MLYIAMFAESGILMWSFQQSSLRQGALVGVCTELCKNTVYNENHKFNILNLSDDVMMSNKLQIIHLA